MIELHLSLLTYSNSQVVLPRNVFRMTRSYLTLSFKIHFLVRQLVSCYMSVMISEALSSKMISEALSKMISEALSYQKWCEALSSPVAIMLYFYQEKHQDGLQISSKIQKWYTVFWQTLCLFQILKISLHFRGKMVTFSRMWPPKRDNYSMD